MADDGKPFYSPDKQAPKREPKPGELLFEFVVGPAQWSVELRDHGEFGVEALFFQNEEFLRSVRFDTREEAMKWAAMERRAIESEA